MNFDFTDDQKSLKEEARRFLTDASPLSAARGVLEGEGDGYDARLWARIVEQGWCGAAIPETYGGYAMGYVELCALAEELGRAISPVPFASSVYQFAESLMLGGSEAQKQALLPGVVTGEMVGTVATTEGPGEIAAGRINARVANGRLSGTKLPVVDGLAATHAVVLAQGDDGPGLYIADLVSDGVMREAVATIDPSRGAARLTFDDVPVEPLGAGDGIALLARIEERAAVMIAFEQIGGADRCLEMARDYALERYAFGRQIGSYQAIKHKLADVFTRNAVARSNAYYAAWALSTDSGELPVAAAAARVAASSAYWLASKEAIQVFGGIGVTWEADNHLFYRRARHLQLVLGSPSTWKRRLVDRLEGRLAAGELA
ncbi:acyl-CoA dehydrogenase family protein [uncultured Sphingomonas sp.]|uniref:acyl-CoA dehydrogenase family protein n=1 Tax=uncultured Sphingomonas sp. TaxID=158754 RepID=UPI00262E3F04|nr:acyl-CoA dehydrogenase family protein [uncultured Sphingomonas sp.]